MSGECLGAYTNMTGQGYPSYFNAYDMGDGRVRLTIRGEPTTTKGDAVCGRHCTHGSELCNDFCRDSRVKNPPAMIYTQEGKTVSMFMSKEAWDVLRASFDRASRDADAIAVPQDNAPVDGLI